MVVSAGKRADLQSRHALEFERNFHASVKVQIFKMDETLASHPPGSVGGSAMVTSRMIFRPPVSAGGME